MTVPVTQNGNWKWPSFLTKIAMCVYCGSLLSFSAARTPIFFVLRPPAARPLCPPPPCESDTSTNPSPQEAHFSSRGRVPATVLLGPVRVVVGGLDKSKKNTAEHARTHVLLSASRPRPEVVLLMPQLVATLISLNRLIPVVAYKRVT